MKKKNPRFGSKLVGKLGCEWAGKRAPPQKKNL